LLSRSINRSQRGWLAPELLRINGELLLMQSTTETTEVVKDLFWQALGVEPACRFRNSWPGFLATAGFRLP
jgi:hypothetical protein